MFWRLPLSMPTLMKPFENSEFAAQFAEAGAGVLPVPGSVRVI
jgi:hypothetical protein